MLPKVVTRCVRFHKSTAVGAFGGCNAGVAAAESGERPCRRAVARDRVYGQARTAERPGAPHIVCIDRDAIGNGCGVVVLPNRIARRS